MTAVAERARIDRTLKKIDKDLAALDKKLGSPGFVDRAPKEVALEARQQRASLLEAKARLEAAREVARSSDDVARRRPRRSDRLAPPAARCPLRRGPVRRQRSGCACATGAPSR